MSLFANIWEKRLKPLLYPAELGGLNYKTSRTEFGILLKLEVNRDMVGLVMGKMASELRSFQDELSEERFEREKAIYRQYICCTLKKPSKLAA
jgi:secreted Zn-dependent insulinase-like peptidase